SRIERVAERTLVLPPFRLNSPLAATGSGQDGPKSLLLGIEQERRRLKNGNCSPHPRTPIPVSAQDFDRESLYPARAGGQIRPPRGKSLQEVLAQESTISAARGFNPILQRSAKPRVWRLLEERSLRAL